MSSRPSRRRVIKHLTTAATVGTVAPLARGATTTPASQPATLSADSITPDDVAVLERVTGHDFTPDERAMMVGNLTARRDVLRSLRARPIPPEVEPAVQFNPRVPGTRVPAGPGECVVSAGEVPPYDGDVESLAFATVVELSRLIHARKVTSVELTRMYLRRLKTIGTRLNCVITLTEDLALAQAERADRELAEGKDRGPLHGIPWGAKDILATKGIPTTWGAAPYREQVFDADATVVRRLEEAGAVLVAKLSLGELAMGDVWFNGLTRNPWDPRTGSQGSSAGSAAATAAGLVGFSIGSETLGSIVSPCTACGTIGLRPTYGRVSRYGAMPLARTMDKLGPICRSVEDCALVLHAIAGSDGLDPTAVDVPFAWQPDADVRSIRLGVDAVAFNLGGLKNEPAAALQRAALAKLGELVGAEPRPITLPPPDDYKGVASLTIAAESAASFAELVASGRVRELRQQEAGSWPNTFRAGAMIPASDYLRAQQVRRRLQHDVHEAFERTGVDAFVTVPFAGVQSAYTNLTGHPSVTFRAGINDKTGRPRMLEIIGNLYREDVIMRLAHGYERSTDFAGKWPDTSGLGT